MSDNVWPDSTQLHILIALCIILMLAYIVMLFVSVYNVQKYLIKEGRWRILLLSSFYAIVILLSLSRISELCAFVRFYDYKNNCKIYFAD